MIGVVVDEKGLGIVCCGFTGFEGVSGIVGGESEYCVLGEGTVNVNFDVIGERGLVDAGECFWDLELGFYSADRSDEIAQNESFALAALIG